MTEKDWDMYDYIIESKRAVRHIVEHRGEIFQQPLDYYFSRSIQQIYVVGSGTSYHASLAAAPIMEKILGIPVISSYPMAFKDSELVHSPDTLVIGISHAGRSTSTIMALARAREEGLATIAATAERGKPLVEHADAAMYIEIGPEYAGPKTKGFIGSIATLVVFALQIALRRQTIDDAQHAEYLRRMIATCDQIPEIAQASTRWYETNREELKQCRRMIVIGYQNCRAAMLEGTLKILEAVRYSVCGYELEEFMHGVYHSIHEDTYMLYIGSAGQYYERMLRMERYFADERTDHNFIITSDERQKDDRKHLVFPFINDPYFATMEYIVPLQVIARRLSADLGIDCNLSSDPDFHRKMGSYTY